MYIMRKMNREKKAATDAERAALLADGYRDVTPSALHEDAPNEIAAPAKTGKVPAGKNRDKVQDSVKKSKAADTRQKEPVAPAGASAQSTEMSESAQKETVEGAAGSEVQQPAGASVQSTELTDSAQPSLEASQKPQ